MSRPIKFRAWDDKHKKMWSAEELGKDEMTINPDGRGFVNVHSLSTKLSRYYHHLIPEQFTDRKDKNGVEVYDGDIIQTKNRGTFVVEWNDEYTRWNWGGSEWCRLDSPVVIGNIRQNPELLEGI